MDELKEFGLVGRFADGGGGDEAEVGGRDVKGVDDVLEVSKRFDGADLS